MTLRPGLGLIYLLGVGAVCLGCSSPPSASTSSVPPFVREGLLKVQVRSVSGTVEPYNPQPTNHGIPAEQVTFRVIYRAGTVARASIRCNVEVFHSDRRVGTTTVESGPASAPASSGRTVSVPVDVAGEPFAGSPSDAHVGCVPV